MNTRPGPAPEALDAIRAWVRLDAAFTAFDKHLRSAYGLTGAQLAMLRIVAESGSTTLAELRARLIMHPATLGQLIDRLAAKGLVRVARDERDGRRRRVTPTEAGRALLGRAPLAGPVRLRAVQADPARLRRLAEAFDDAVELFALSQWVAA